MSAATSAPASTSAPSGKVWQEKGDQAWLTLPNGEKLEFAKCPPGKVDYRVARKRNERAEISRPFWIMTRPLAVRNLKSYAIYARVRQEKNDDPYNYVTAGSKGFGEFAENVTEDVLGAIPKGYVVRLPSFGEWQHAIKANSHDSRDPYSIYDVDDKAWKQVVETTGKGLSPKNKWGIHEFCFERLLDKADSENAKVGGKGILDALKFSPDQKKDPLFWSEDMSASQFSALPARKVQADDRPWKGRLVIGPDLVSEWKAKHSKK